MALEILGESLEQLCNTLAQELQWKPIDIQRPCNSKEEKSGSGSIKKTYTKEGDYIYCDVYPTFLLMDMDSDVHMKSVQERLDQSNINYTRLSELTHREWELIIDGMNGTTEHYVGCWEGKK